MRNFTLFSQIALVLSVPVSISLFFLFRPPRAALIAILGGEMFLPEVVNFKFPLLPPLDKHNLPFICVILGCLLRRPSLVTKACKERWFVVLSIVLLVGAALTGLTNGMSIVVRRFHPAIPGIHLTDGLYSGLLNFSLVAVPFYLGWALFRREPEFRELLSALVIGAVVYLPFAAFEMRMSPNLHLWIYGFSQHEDFTQTFRSGGYRPMVFMTHGLALARFFLVGTCSAFILGRLRVRIFGVSAKTLGWGLLLILILCKSVGAIMFAAVAVPLLLLARPKLEVRLALVLALFAGLYPLLRTWELIPTEQILSFLRSLVGEERSGSLAFRFVNEDLLLKKAREHFMFGWGQFGRNFAPWGWDGQTVPDGYWVIQLGILGLCGFIATFGPVVIPLVLMPSRLKAVVSLPHRKLLSGAALMLGLVALDWIPNGLFTAYPYLIAGALAGASREFVEPPAPPVIPSWIYG